MVESENFNAKKSS